MQQTIVLSVVIAAVCVQSVVAVITVQIGGATRLNSLSRQRERYSCYWDCDLVGCQIAREDDECAYDCEKICRIKYDYTATGRSGINGAASSHSDSASNSEGLRPKSSVIESVNKPTAEQGKVVGAENVVDNEIAPELMGAGTSVRLHLPRNASARNFAIWERCSPDASTGKLTEKPFNL